MFFFDDNTEQRNGDSNCHDPRLKHRVRTVNRGYLHLYPISVRDWIDDCGSARYFCTHACLAAHLDEAVLTTREACEWSPDASGVANRCTQSPAGLLPRNPVSGGLLAV